MPIRPPRGFIDETDPRVCRIGLPAPPWLVNYADLMTEMVCFFIILYALSAALNKNVQNAAQQVRGLMRNGELKGAVQVDREGLKISLEEQGQVPFFQSGSADTTPEMEEKVAKIAPMLKKLSEQQDIIVEGHTDNQRIHNEYFDSNWELSTARATSVTRLLTDKFGLPAARMGAIGYGEYRPIVPNDTSEHKAKNRRVVFFVKNAPLGVSAKGPPAAGKAAATAVAPTSSSPPGVENGAPSGTARSGAPPVEEAR